jgi:hypothetical protein
MIFIFKRQKRERGGSFDFCKNNKKSSSTLHDVYIELKPID